MKSFLGRIVAFASVAGSAAQISWVKGGDGSEAVCAGIDETCSDDSDVAECTRVSFGLCQSTGEPTTYLTQRVLGFALTQGTDSQYMTGIELLEPNPISSNGYLAYEKDLVAGSGTFTSLHFSSGSWVGDNPETIGGYIGTASYLMQGGSISTDVNDFMIPVKAGVPETFVAGAFKFSLFGFTCGSAFSMPDGTTYVGIRTSLTLVTTSTQVVVTYNGDKNISTIGTSDVTLITVTMGDKIMELKFPQSYNVGDLLNGEASENNSKNIVNIKVAQVPSDPYSVYVDYLFAASDLQVADKYFVYDPTVTVQTAVSEAIMY
ncbi:unnamed protein product [Polarella glacialis]|uniref:Uncharacterized protein n=1 Tax=Polarella glacialis TaxID=89957 RepID=A0A813KP27_POLGL|nr:unnamed protein product [Polarella glacialis]